MESSKLIKYFIKSNLFKTISILTIFSILIVSLIVTITPAHALISGACNCVIFRLDDLQDEFVGPEQVAVMQKFIDKNEKLSLGIIMNDIGTDQTVINKVQEGHQSGLFELTLHGWMHVDYKTLTLANQKSTLQLASAKMITLWGRNSTIFILPYNSYNTNTLQAMQDIGLKIISSEFDQELNPSDVYHAVPGSDIKDSNGIYHLPQVVEFYRQDVDPPVKNSLPTIMTKVTDTINQYGYAIVTLHPQDFGDTNSPYTIRILDIADLDTLISTIKSTGYSIKSFSDVTGVPLPPLVGGIPVTTANPSGGAYSTAQLITLIANEPATIYYTIDGSTPTQLSSTYSSPILISTTTTLKFFAKDVDGNVESIKTQMYTFDTTPPTFTIQYYSNSGLTTSLGDNPKLKTGTYYLKINPNETLTGTPTVSINAEGTANDVTNAATSLVSGSYRYTRIIANDAAAFGSTLEDISITGTDNSANTSTNVNPTDEATKVAYTDTVLPIVTDVSSTSANIAYSSGTIPITITFSEPITVTGTPRIQLNSGGSIFANYASGSGTSTLTFNYVIAAGQDSADLDYSSTSALTLNGGTIRDSALNNVVLTLASPGSAGSLGANKAIVIDSTAPTVILSTPENPTNDSPFTITAQFSEPVTGVDISDFAVVGGTKNNFVAVDADTYTANITPTTGSIIIDIASSSASDLAGNGNTIASQLAVTFDSTIPTVTLSTPLNPTPRTTFTIIAQFSEPVTGVTIDDFTLVGGNKGVFVAVDNDTFRIDVTKTENLITINLASGISSDLAGNGNTAAVPLAITFNSAAPTPGICSPTSGNWTITLSCTIIDDISVTGNVDVQNNAVLTIENGASLDIDFTAKYLKVHSGSGVLIKSGGKIN